MIPSLVEAAAVLRSGERRAIDVVAGALAAAQRLQPSLRAFTRIDAESAMAAAEAADALRRGGRPLGPLHGVPLAHKDLFDRAGFRASYGAAIAQAEAAAVSATVIARLEAAGAITIGALNMSEFALGPTGHNATFGHCRNPWNPERVSGGSSSGAGAAVAAGIVFGAIGSDTGGSVRIPAACCGLIGLKPTQHRISAAGAMPLSRSLDCFGPLTRTVADCRLLFGLIAGADPRDPLCLDAPLGDAAAIEGQAVQRLRIAVPADHADFMAEPAAADALAAAVEVFRALGAAVVPRVLPEIDPLHDLADAIQKPESAAAHFESLAAFRHLYTPHVRRRIEPGLAMAAPAYIRAVEQRRFHQRSFLENILAGVDALILPAVGVATPKVDETDEEQLGAIPDLVGRMTRCTRWLSYLGVPSVTVPCGRDGDGMPIGMQIVGRPLAEMRILAIAELFEREAGWGGVIPPIADEAPATWPDGAVRPSAAVPDAR